MKGSKNMPKIKRFIECLVPVTVCNLKCSYCYIIQENRRTNKLPNFKYNYEYIAKALSKERLGGIAYISICGAGETLIPPEMPNIIKAILAEGHYVNITTNGTLKNRFEEILKFPKEYLERLHFSFSFHYIELKRTNNIKVFFENIKKLKSKDCSFLIQVNLCDEYIPYLEEIKKECIENVGELPQIAATRNEYEKKITLMTKKTEKEYYEIGSEFNSPLFEFTMKNFNAKRNEFCYAGDWSFLLDLSNGEARKCYSSVYSENIFKDINKPIKFEAIGNNCKSKFCVNSSHFMSLGIIPNIETPTYAELRNRENANWYSQKMLKFLSHKLIDNNRQYSCIRKIKSNMKYRIKSNIKKISNKSRKLLNIQGVDNEC